MHGSGSARKRNSFGQLDKMSPCAITRSVDVCSRKETSLKFDSFEGRVAAPFGRTEVGTLLCLP
jgi:hypothetical protein